ncbi:MAG: methyltransferase [Aliishimia sp.]
MEEVTITHLGRHGDGVADGPTYVPRALPGEIVKGLRKDDVLGDIRIVEPSQDRVSPPCRHFKACGGCNMQHVSDPLVAQWKEGIVKTALEMNHLETTTRAILTSPDRSRRRAKYAARRTKSGAMAGFHGRASGTIVDIQDCPLVENGLQSAPEVARALAEIGGSRKAELSVQCTVTLDGLDVAVEGGKPLDQTLIQTLPVAMTRFGMARLTWNGELVAQNAAPRHKIGSVDVILPPGAFLQATDHAEQMLQACVVEALGNATKVADLFAGCGTFALHLAQTRPVYAVEGDEAMTRALQDAANRSNLTYPVTSATCDLFRNPLYPDELKAFDAVVLDPPRAGAIAQVEQIAQAQVPVIAYVSCDPGSFVRDAAILVEAGYVLDWVQPIDQFRWSSHVELAARLCLPHMLPA